LECLKLFKIHSTGDCESTVGAAFSPPNWYENAANGGGDELEAAEARLKNLLEQASKKEPSYAEFLDDLLNCEAEVRRTRHLRARLHVPFVKTFEQLDLSFHPSTYERQIWELRSYGLFTKPAMRFFSDTLGRENAQFGRSWSACSSLH
jgi:hypothetical protein